MASRIQIRRGFSYNWEAVNPILAQGEMGYELDTGKMKIGDGETAWNPLQYFGGAAGNGFSGKYEDLIGVPTLLSGFNNDAGFITAEEVPSDISDLTDNTGLLTNLTGKITFDENKIIGAPAGPGSFSVLELVPNQESYLNGQFVVIDSRSSNHVSLYPGNTAGSGTTSIQIGAPRSYIKTSEASGITMSYEGSKLTTSVFESGTDFTSSIWEQKDSNGVITFTNPIGDLIGKLYSFVNDQPTYIEITTSQGATRLTITGFTNTGINEYQLLVGEAPTNGVTQSILTISVAQLTSTINQVKLSNNDLTAEISNNIDISSQKSFVLSSTDDSISVISNRSKADQKTWKFDVDGSLVFPDSTKQFTAVSNLTSLSDIAVTSPVAGQVLSFNGLIWTNSGSQATDLSSYLLASDAADTYQAKNENLTGISSLTESSGLVKKTSTGWELDKSTYLTSYTESDPVFSASPAGSITSTQVTNWETSHSWGNHADAGYFSPAITTTNGTTASINNGESYSLDLAGGKAYILYKIQTSAAAWVRVYNSASARLADADRSQGVDPSVSSGVIAEAITTGAETVVFAPAPNGFNNETPPTTVMPIAVTNLSGSNTSITVTITKLTLVS